MSITVESTVTASPSWRNRALNPTSVHGQKDWAQTLQEGTLTFVRHRVHRDTAHTPHTQKSWVSAFVEELSRLQNTAAGWNAGSGEPPQRFAVIQAFEFINAIWWRDITVKPDRISISTDGGVVVAFLGEGVRANIEFFGDEGAAMCIARDDEAVLVKEIGVGAHIEGNDEAVLDALDEIETVLASSVPATNATAPTPRRL